MLRSRRALPLLIFVLQLLIVVLIVRQWAYVTTYRLYLDRAVSAARRTTATQLFNVERGRVVPRLVTRESERLLFETHIGSDVDVEITLDPVRPVNYSVTWQDGAAHGSIARGLATAATRIDNAFPTGTGVLVLEADGPVNWIDPRLVRPIRIGRHVVALIALTMVSWLLMRCLSSAERRAGRLRWFRTTAFVTSLTIGLVLCEVTLRLLGDRAPAGVLTQRHDLGEVTRDVRWEDTVRYGHRLRANVDAENEWRYGDIVRMGYVPSVVSPAVWHRFQFKTDAEGFRNRRVRERVDIAAIGDSFTDAMTMAVESSWPARLERLLGRSVQNYGTAGFGPQQEIRVLDDYVVRHHPSWIVLAYFAGNDLFDAERFEQFEQSGGVAVDQGWRIKEVYSRADTWYVTSALSASAGWFASRPKSFVVPAAAEAAHEQPPVAAAAPFDRGLFSLDVNGHPLQWAFMPPYLNTLNFSPDELNARRGWRLTRDALLAAQRSSLAAHARFVVVFLPFKSQVYWPTLERSMPRSELESAMTFYLGESGRPIDIDAMRRNRLAQNMMLREFCDSAGIPFLDVTSALQRRFESGENVYFPDESHLNEVGESIVADTVADFLRAHDTAHAISER